MTKWIGVDLDGTLSRTIKMEGVKIGPVIPEMRDRVRSWLNDGRAVRILTARKLTGAQLKAIRDFLDKNGIENIPIQNHKDNDMLELWDDKAIRVKRNTGEVCSGCAGHSNSTHEYVNKILTDW